MATLASEMPIRQPVALIDPAAWPVVSLLLTLLAGLIGAAVACGFSDSGDLLPTALALTYALGCGLALRRIAPRMSTAVMLCVLLLAAAVIVCCLCLVLATSALPFRDGWFAAADRWLGFDWPAAFAAIRRHDQLITVMCGIYTSLVWQPFLLVASLVTLGRAAQAWRFAYAWLLALTICVVLFPFLPALGTYAHYGVTAADVPAMTVTTGWRQPEVLQAVRSGAIHMFEPVRMTGIIAFPSFHTAGAVLLAWAFRRVPIIGWPFVALNAAMVATAPFVGAHYFVDILAGGGVAAIAIWLSKRADARADPATAVITRRRNI